MHCKFCGFGNSEDDHRCLRCGRRLGGIVIAAPEDYRGATALALDREKHPLESRAAEGRERLTEKESVRQTALFPQQGVPNVIPFEEVQRLATGRLAPNERRTDAPAAPEPLRPPATAPAQSRTSSARQSARRPAGDVAAALRNDAQGTLDFIVAPAARTRTLKTNVEAQVYCDQPVATPMHRFVAGAIDSALILLGFGLFIIVCQAVGGGFGAGKLFWISLALAFVVVSAFYGLIWTIAGRETAGMRMTELQLITFDGFPLDGPTRALRLLATWLSFCSAGIGLVWAMADEESLTWHDHISKTFPTIREAPRNFVRR